MNNQERTPDNAKILLKGYYLVSKKGCWIWQSRKTSHGYGFMSRNGKGYYAHRISYEIYKGEIPTGLQIDHLCRVPACVNPDHLEAVTQKVNILRGFSPSANYARQTHCYKGHKYDGDTEKNGRKRRCRICSRAAWKAKYERRRIEINKRRRELRHEQKIARLS